MVDASTKKTLSSIPLCQTKAGPRDKELWVQRLKEEYTSLIKVIIFIYIYDVLIQCIQHAEQLLLFILWNFIKPLCELESVFVLFSMSKITKSRTMIGLDWNRIKKAPSGLVNVGTFTTCWNTNLTLNSMWVSWNFLFYRFHDCMGFDMNNLFKDSCHVSNYCAWISPTRAWWQNS